MSTKQALRNVLLALGEGEIRLECARQQICNISRFVPANAYQRIDRSCNGQIEGIEIADYLAEHGVFRSESECNELVEFYSDNTKDWNISAFKQVVLPCEKNELKDEVLDRKPKRVHKCCEIPAEQNSALVKIFVEELNLQYQINALKKVLQEMPEYSAEKCFNTIDSQRSKKISSKDINAFLGSVCNNIIYAIIRRIDTNADDAIEIAEWTDFFSSAKIHAPDSKVTVKRHKAQHIFTDHCFKCHGGRPKKSDSGADGAGGSGGDGKVQNDVLFGLGVLASLAVATVNPVHGAVMLAGAVGTHVAAGAIDDHNDAKRTDEDGNVIEASDQDVNELIQEPSVQEDEPEDDCTCKIEEEQCKVICLPVSAPVAICAPVSAPLAICAPSYTSSCRSPVKQSYISTYSSPVKQSYISTYSSPVKQVVHSTNYSYSNHTASIPSYSYQTKPVMNMLPVHSDYTQQVTFNTNAAAPAYVHESKRFTYEPVNRPQTYVSASGNRYYH